MKYDAFLSYSRQDKRLMHVVRDALKAAGLKVWTDETLTPGTESWKNAIENAIHNAAYLVVLLSPDAKQSDWIEKEMDYARVCGVPIIPVLVRGDDERGAIPFELINVQRIDTREDFDAGVGLLVATLKGEAPIMITDEVPIIPPSSNTPTYTKSAINPNNFYDQMQIAWWLLYQPQKLKAHGLTKNDIRLQKAAAWIGSYLIWLGLIIPSIGFVLGTVVIPDTVPGFDRVLMIFASIVFLGLWFVTGLIGWRKGFYPGFLLFILSALMTALLFILAYVRGGIVFSDAERLSGVFFTLWTAITLGYAYGIGAQLANGLIGAALGQAGGSLVFIAIFGVTLGASGGAAIVLTVIVAVLTATTISIGLQAGQRSWLNTVLLASVGLVVVSMVWVFFLGGWQVLS